MFILRASSATLAAQPARAAEVKAKPVSVDAPATDGTFVDVGLPVPETYNVDIIRALLQDPFRIFIYWEVRQESLNGLTHYFSTEEAERFRVTLKLIEVEGGGEAFFEVGLRGRYWMMVFPDREYEFEIGVRSPEHGYIALLKSNRVRTPRGTVSPEPALEPEYKLSAPQFLNVLEASGFSAVQALDITVSALPGANADAEDLSDVLVKLPDPLREALTAASAGEPLTEELVNALPGWLRSELRRLLFGGDARLASAALIHYLPELLREALEDERELIGDRVHPLRVTPRFLVGASENVSWPAGEFKLPAFRRPPPVSGSGFMVRSSDFDFISAAIRRNF
ncbi:MAG TPA: DUF4912 domain-containing protein [Blastocatellia bacterium]|nr:DUF4912 domain-containing protein [Blastocatellia bacterium]